MTPNLTHVAVIYLNMASQSERPCKSIWFGHRCAKFALELDVELQILESLLLL